MKKNLWPIEFKGNLNSPKFIIEEQATMLSSITGGRVVAYVKIDKSRNDINNTLFGQTKRLQLFDSIEKTDNINVKDFEFSFIIKGNVLDYSFIVFRFSFKIDFYPVNFILDEEIANELEINNKITLSSDEEILNLLNSIFNTEKVSRVVNGILTIQEEEYNWDS